MAAFEYTREGGIWTDISDLQAWELQDLDHKTSKALNAVDGGTWAPIGVIEIGGAGINVTGPAQFADVEITGSILFSGADAVFGGNTTFEGLFFNVNQASSYFGGPVEFDGTTNFNGTGTFQGFLGVNGNFGVGGDAVFHASLSLDGDLLANAARFNGECDLNGDVLLGGSAKTVTARGPIKFSSYGRILSRAVNGSNQPNTAYSARTAQWVNFTPNNPSQGSTYLIADDGDEFDAIGFSNRSGYTLLIAHPNGSGLVSLPTEHWCWNKKMFGTWTTLMFGSFHTLNVDIPSNQIIP